MKVNFSNNTADAVLTVRNSGGAVVGMLKSIGKRDVLLSVPVTAGTYTFTVDTNAAFRMNKGYSIYITYPLTDLAKPSAVITAPITDQIVKGTVDFSATARDDTAVTKVEFYVDGTLLGTDTTAGYGIKWDTTVVANGLHNLAVKSYDAEGNVGSATGVVTVSNTVAQLPGDGGTAGARFPGDPNPRVTGKAYWGLNGTRAGEHESATGKSSSIHRTFANAWGKTSQLVSNIKEDHSKNRLPWVSIKTPGWGTLASGSRDGEIDTMLRSLDSAAAGKPVWLTVHHEFEGDTTTTGEYTRANYKAMQTKIRQRMTAVGTKNIAFMPIYVGYSWADVTRFNPQDWYVEGIWDAIAFDHYSDNANQDPLRTAYFNAVKWIEAKGLPYAIGEWGTRDYGNTTQAAKEMRDFWNWGFDNKKDGVGFAYYDSMLNSPEGSWELAGARQDTWRDILKNDTRVQRINDLAQ